MAEYHKAHLPGTSQYSCWIFSDARKSISKSSNQMDHLNQSNIWKYQCNTGTTSLRLDIVANPTFITWLTKRSDRDRDQWVHGIPWIPLVTPGAQAWFASIPSPFWHIRGHFGMIPFTAHDLWLNSHRPDPNPCIWNLIKPIPHSDLSNLIKQVQGLVNRPVMFHITQLLGRFHLQQIFVLVMWNKSPKRDINPNPWSGYKSGFPKSSGYPQPSSKAVDHDLVLKPMVTWGTPILGNLQNWVSVFWGKSPSLDPNNDLQHIGLFLFAKGETWLATASRDTAYPGIHAIDYVYIHRHRRNSDQRVLCVYKKMGELQVRWSRWITVW